MSASLLTERCARGIKGTIECFDRILLFGTYGSVAYPKAMENLLHLRGVRLLDYTKTYANELRLAIASHIRQTAAAENLPLIQVKAWQRKEALMVDLRCFTHISTFARAQPIARTAAVEIQCSDIYRCLGKRQFTARSKAEASSCLQTLIQGTRIKHTLGKTNRKM